jgi:hypothetical protein
MGSSKKDKKGRSSKPKDAGASVVSLLVNPHIEGRRGPL